MKKIYIILITLLVIFSCKKEEEKIISSFKLPIESSSYNKEGDKISSSNYFYDDDNKMIRRTRVNKNLILNTETSFKTIFSYANDKISLIEYYRDNDNLYEKVIYKYNKDNLVEETFYDENDVITHIYKYEYNDKPELIKESSISYVNGQPKVPFVTDFEYSNNSTKGLKENGDYYIIVYDDSKNPFSEIPHFNSRKKNIVSYSYYSSDDLLNTTASYKNENEYDDEGFLIKVKNIDEFSTTTIEYTYNK